MAAVRDMLAVELRLLVALLRSIVNMMLLEECNQQTLSNHNWSQIAYGMRSQNAAMTMNLFFGDICNFQTSWSGRMSITISVAMSQPVMMRHLSS
jgi:hypothetical protein